MVSEASSTTTSRWMGTDTVPPIPALAPKATWTVPRIFSSSSTLPVELRAVVGADPELGQVGARLSVRPEQLEVLGTEAMLGGDDAAVLDREPSRFVGQAQRGQARGDDRARAVERGDKALPRGQVPERARRGEGAVVGDAAAARQVKGEVRAPRAGEMGVVGGGQQLGQVPRARGHDVEVNRHHPGQHVGGDPGQGGAAGAGLRGPLARGRVAEGAAGGSDEHIAGGQGGGDRARRVGPVGGPLVHDRQHSVGARAGGALAQSLPDLAGGRIDHDEHILAGLDRQALLDHRADGWLEVGHAAAS